jgi:hypothetical protein
MAWPSRLNSAASSFSASAMPTALVMPWPSGPVVVSTPGVTPTSGWPAVLLCSCAELLQLLQRQVVAGEVQQRVDQHRPVAVGQHEAVAVEPLRIGRVVLQVAVPQGDGDVRHAHGRAGVARVGLLHRVHGQRPDRVGHLGGVGDRRGSGRGRGCGREEGMGEEVRENPAFYRLGWPGPAAAAARRLGLQCFACAASTSPPTCTSAAANRAG